MQITSQRLSDIVAAIRAESGEDAKLINKRRHSRLEVEAKVEIAAVSKEIVPRRYSALTRDIAYGGIGLFQSVPASSGQQIVVRLPLGKGQIILVRSRIAHCRVLAYSLFGVGVEFEDEVGLDFLEQLALASEEELKRIRQSILA